MVIVQVACTGWIKPIRQWQPVGRGPTVDLLAIFCGPRAIRFHKVFVGRMLAANKK